ncbi:autotransporter domain-containing protein [Chroococcidiopsis sp. TS-821]|uniref:autotransporter domain-containing protein n=1 Tax=Chroococcidiopsis sp. TS-821 TaxID=1378066 RepID=UPI000CEE53E5|nr:autotransporter domain-containing protein [Chroococcidiopsis sp. TS-821]PPS39633.1 autotransporter outer membrane beta-barrel domain-containing protein [Chroococcidiopsis sp. TS-821]
MKKIVAVALFVFAMLPLKVSAQNYSEFYIFGDSLVDDGNLFQLTGGLIPPNPPYFNGRFSNGLVFVEILGTELGIPTEATNNYAFGGTTSGNVNALNLLVGTQLPSLPAQLNLFLTTAGTSSTDALYVLWTGANDYIILPPELRTIDTQTVVNNLSNTLTTLIDAGARNLIVPNLPDLGNTPQERVLPTATALTALTNSHNANLRTALQGLAASRDVNIIPLDVNALLGEVTADPLTYGLTNVTDRCLGNPNCTNPDEFLFWDGIHPSAQSHRIISEYATAVITAPQAIIPQADIALNIAKRYVQHIDARLSALRGVQTLTEGRLGVFLNGNVNFGDRDSTNNEVGYDFINTNITAGVDYRVTNNLALGVALGYVNNDTDLSNNLGDINVDGYAVSVYSNFVQNNFYTDAVLSYGNNNFNIARRTNFYNRTATADTNGNQFSADLNSGYAIRSGNVAYGPTLGLRYDRIHIDGYTENNAGSLNLRVDDQSAESFVLSVGAQAAVAFNTDVGTVIPHLRASYERELAENNREIVTELITQPGIPLRTRVGDRDRDYVKLGIGAQIVFSENALGLIDYETTIGRENFNNQVIKGELRYQF